MMKMRPPAQMGRILATAAAATAMLKKVPNIKKILRRLTSPVDFAKTFAPCGVLCKYVKLFGYDVWTSCFVNFNLRKSCKLGLRRMCCHYEFIVETCLPAVKHGVCSKRLTLNEIFLIFDLKFHLNFRWIASIFLHFSFFVKTRAPLLRTRALRGFWRRSPLALSLLDSNSPMLVIL
jgi:hypothetical protein